MARSMNSKYKKALLFLLFLVMNPKIKCDLRTSVYRPPPPPTQPTPLCSMQFSVASRACAVLPFSAVSPPSPTIFPPPPQDLSSPSPDSPPSPVHRHRHRRHRHSQQHIQTPVEQECCHWLQAIDNECVCTMLVYLPVFMSKPTHTYTVVTDPSCNVTFSCPGRLIAL